MRRQSCAPDLPAAKVSSAVMAASLGGVPTCLALRAPETLDIMGADAEGTEQENIFIGTQLNAAVNQEGVDWAFLIVVAIVFVAVAVGVAVAVVVEIVGTPSVVQLEFKSVQLLLWVREKIRQKTYAQ